LIRRSKENPTLDREHSSLVLPVSFFRKAKDQMRAEEKFGQTRDNGVKDFCDQLSQLPTQVVLCSGSPKQVVNELPKVRIVCCGVVRSAENAECLITQITSVAENKDFF